MFYPWFKPFMDKKSNIKNLKKMVQIYFGLRPMVENTPFKKNNYTGDYEFIRFVQSKKYKDFKNISTKNEI